MNAYPATLNYEKDKILDVPNKYSDKPSEGNPAVTKSTTPNPRVDFSKSDSSRENFSPSHQQLPGTPNQQCQMRPPDSEPRFHNYSSGEVKTFEPRNHVRIPDPEVSRRMSEAASRGRGNYLQQPLGLSNPLQGRVPGSEFSIAPASQIQISGAFRNPTDQALGTRQIQNQSNPSNFQKQPTEPSPQNHRSGGSLQVDEIPGDFSKRTVGYMSRKGSNLEFHLELNNQRKVNEIERSAQAADKNNNANPRVIRTETEVGKLKSEIVEKLEAEKEKPFANPTGNFPDKGLNSLQNEASVQLVPKPEIIKSKESRNNREKVRENTGAVHKNIKFFEEKDTARTPLTPKVLVAKRKEWVTKTDIDCESCVDETPMIHPNLRSIFQEPSKVARIPNPKRGKGKNEARTVWSSIKKQGSKKSKGRCEEKSKSVPWRSCTATTKTETLTRRSTKGKQRIDLGNPEEELLAFFNKSKQMQKINRDGRPKSVDRGTKEKLALKATTNGDIVSPKKTPSKLPSLSKKSPSLSSPTKTPLKSPGTPGPRSATKTPESPTPPTPLIKKVPMNKIQVGAAPSPNLKAVRSKVGSLVNTTHKPGGGNIRIESHKVDFSKAQPRIEAKNDQYAPSGGDKKIPQVKLQWSAKSKVGSLENATYKPGGGEKKIESVKLDFKEKAKPKVGSKDNVKHVPGGGAIKIESQKLEFKAQSKIGSLDNVKHKPGGGDIKIFDDKTYLKQVSGNSSEGRVSGTQSFGDLSIVREIESTSVPGTPGCKTAVKIKKTTTIHSDGPTGTLKNVTEVKVASETPKRKLSCGKSPSRQEVKLTYSKLTSSVELPTDKDTVEVIKVPVKDHAPILKPSLTNKDAAKGDDETGKGLPLGSFLAQTSGDNSSSKDTKNTENVKQSLKSSNLPESKFRKDSDRFVEQEIDAHEKVGDIWKEMNTFDGNSRQEKPSHNLVSANTKVEFNFEQRKPRNTSESSYDQKTTDVQINPTLSKFSENKYQSMPFPQYEGQTQVNPTAQTFLAPTLLQQGNVYVPPQEQPQSFTTNNPQPEFNNLWNRPL